MTTKQYDAYSDLITFTRASTGTYLDSDGLLKTATTNTPRIEYDANGNRRGLLIEEARTNIEPYSETFDNPQWNKGNVTLTANQATAPDGTLTADLMQQATGTGFYILEDYLTGTVLGSTTYTASFFVKHAGEDIIEFGVFDSTAGHMGQADFQFSTETITLQNGTSANFDAFGNGWYRVYVTFTSGPTLTSTRIRVLLNAGGSGTGDGTSGIYIWGAQLEAGSFPTSYIPTSGSTATRSADVASIPTSAFGFNPDKGTVVVDWSHFMTDDVAGGMAVGFDNGSSNERMWFYGNKGQWIGSVGGVTSFNLIAPNPADFVSHKAAAVYGLDDFALVVDAGSVLSDTLSGVPSVTAMRIGGTTATTLIFLNGHIKSIQYYPRRLTNAQLQELTS